MTFKPMTTNTPDQVQIQDLIDADLQAQAQAELEASARTIQSADVVTTNDWFFPEEPVAGLPSTRIIDKPTHEFFDRDVYVGSDAAEIFNLRNYFVGSHRIPHRTEVIARGGDDEINGSNINDYINAGDGNDRVFGNYGDDVVNGESGNDQLYGRHGNDRLNGGHGDDYLVGGDGYDHLDGADGNDLMYGDNGNDRLFGGNGNDFLNGGEGRDFLYGQHGNDFLNGDQGNDVLTGGFGADTFVFSVGQDVVTDFNFFEGDRINLSGFQGVVSVTEYRDASGTVHTAVSKSADNFMAFKAKSGLEIVAGLQGNEGLSIRASNFHMPRSAQSSTEDTIAAEDLISSMVVTDDLAF